MPRPTKLNPERGDARSRLMLAARDLIRSKGFCATSVDDLCRSAGVTKGAFFHQFGSKEGLGVAAAEFWSQETSSFFAAAPYHQPTDPLDRVLAYIAFRRSIIGNDLAQASCLVGTMAQEIYLSSPDIRDACSQSIFSHAATMVADIEAARRSRGIDEGWSAEGLAKHMQAVLQGGFVLAKAANDPQLARDSLDHLDMYVRHLFHVTKEHSK